MTVVFSSSPPLKPCSPPRFIVLEGIDGSGKSTQARMLGQFFEHWGIAHLLTREPSDLPVGVRLRSLATRLDAKEEARLFTEDRRRHLEQVIRPALEAGLAVICDRYVHSSVAYQGARGADVAGIIASNARFVLSPDLVILMEVPVETALARIHAARGPVGTVFEQRSNLEAVAAIYRSLEDAVIFRVDGTSEPQEIHRLIVERISPERKPWPLCNATNADGR